MKGMKRLLPTLALLGLALALTQPATADDITYIGTWDSVGSGNPTGSGGPGMAAGQRYVIRISWDNLSAITTGVEVLDSSFSGSGNFMQTINLDDPGNSLDIFVPMEGLDAGSPFIYTQNEGDHFPDFIPSPTLNFIDGSDISDVGNVIGLEYEGDFAGAANNFIELFNTSPSGGTVNMVSQILNLGVGPAANDTNGLVAAVDVIVESGPDIVYDAASLTQTATSAVTQSNDLGAARADGEDFVDVSWSQTGVATGNNIDVAIADSGLTMTTSMTSWVATATEQMTLESDTDSLMVSYLNATPTANASAVATATGTDFTLVTGDADLAVNVPIPGFEMLSVSALIDGFIDGTAFFAGLFPGGGTMSSTHVALEAAFGLGPHSVAFTVTDKAGAQVTTAAAGFEVLDAGIPPPVGVPEPNALALMMLGLLGLVVARRRSLFPNG